MKRYPVRLLSSFCVDRKRVGHSCGPCPIGYAATRSGAEALYAKWGYKFTAELIQDDTFIGWFADPGIVACDIGKRACMERGWCSNPANRKAVA